MNTEVNHPSTSQCRALLCTVPCWRVVCMLFSLYYNISLLGFETIYTCVFTLHILCVGRTRLSPNVNNLLFLLITIYIYIYIYIYIHIVF